LILAAAFFRSHSLGRENAEFATVVRGTWSAAFDEGAASAFTDHVPTKLGIPVSAEQTPAPSRKSSQTMTLVIYFIFASPFPMLNISFFSVTTIGFSAIAPAVSP
jgi:hypothetical protein